MKNLFLSRKKEMKNWDVKFYKTARNDRKNVVSMKNNAKVNELIDSFEVNPERIDLNLRIERTI